MTAHVWAVTLIDDDYSPPFIDTLILKDLWGATGAIKQRVTEFYRCNDPDFGSATSEFDWAKVEQQLTRKQQYCGVDNTGFQIYAKKITCQMLFS
jgi:hypothetical protein